MSWLKQNSRLEELLALQPEMAVRYQAFLRALETSDHVPSRVLALCQARIEQIHGGPGEGVPGEDLGYLATGDFSHFAPDEQAALDAAERIPYQHHQLQDEEVEAVRLAFGDAGCVTLLTALSIFDMQARLKLTLATGEI
ncbi:MAG: hypothetical protein O3B72_06645 [Proteobacteria bacterium]|nr:hypothetical protein [Pseudomonadota bacterium]